jgi:hypothetical protein
MKISDLFEQSFMNLRFHQPEGTFYHGTSDKILSIGDKLIPPNDTGMLSERGRKVNLDKVFFTHDKRSASTYARKAVKEFGGNPVVYEVSPIGDIGTLNDKPGTTVFHADWAYIKKVA